MTLPVLSREKTGDYLSFEPPVQKDQLDVEFETTSILQVERRDHDQEQQSSLGLDQCAVPYLLNLIQFFFRFHRNQKKLKSLNQKVRRLRNRNQYLKDILKKLKQDNFIDTDLYNNLNQYIVAVNIFNNYNRKKLKKNIKYTQKIKKFYLTLNFYSPKAYDYVMQSFNTCLPHR
ncbi:hypothetical protein ABMA27_000352 [Loxostege sticticalis]|uniref:THAP9-like helix-turn-helix domain-containing protein n=1 Tax=Loxostege sticticalis TaxID=481309 RepID=A0ABR3INC0_LOXSC